LYPKHSPARYRNATARAFEVCGRPLHIIQLGNNRITCFFAEEDYRFYLRHLEELAQRFECGVHAYVLMTNLRNAGQAR
jgi:REP element-mobilizing transposase RayT